MDLATAITSDILDAIFDLRFPGTGHDAPDWTSTSGSPLDPRVRELVWPLLVDLSSHGPSTEGLHLTTLLPSPAAANFPQHAVALIFLLDQCPRYFCMHGTDARWTAAFFDQLAQDLLTQLFALPPHLQILCHERWNGIGYADYLWVSALLFTSADHSEELTRHRHLKQLAEQRRAEIEKRTGVKDPFAGKLVADAQDPTAFSRWMTEGLPKVTDIYQWAYLRLAIVSIHLPIIERFGRYPYRNAALGRPNTAAEKDFLSLTNGFGAPDAATADAILADIQADRWTAFGPDPVSAE